MLKLIIGAEKENIVEFSGDVTDVCGDIGFCIGDIYSGLKKAAPETAARFRALMTVLINSPKSPVWEIQDHDGSMTIVVGSKVSGKDGHESKEANQ